MNIITFNLLKMFYSLHKELSCESVKCKTSMQAIDSSSKDEATSDAIVVEEERRG